MGMAMALHGSNGTSNDAAAAAAADAAMELMNAVGGVDPAAMAASMAAAVQAASAAMAAVTSTAVATRAAVPAAVSTLEAAALATASAVDSTTAAAAAADVAAGAVPSPSSNVGAGSAIRRKSIPLSMKKQAIEWILGPGKGVPSRAEKHFSALNWDVSASSFRKWWKNREKIMHDSSTKKRISGGGRKPYLEEGEERLLVIVIQERAKKDRVTRKWIAKTAQHMFQRTNANFKASENWVTKFIRRNGLTLKRSYVTYDHTSGDAAGSAATLVHGSAAQALGIAPGTIEVHDEDDDEDEDDDMDDDQDDEQSSGSMGTAGAVGVPEPADAIVV